MNKIRGVFCALGVAVVFLGCVHTQERVSGPVIHRIVEKGELVVGTAASMPPLNMTTKRGEITGLEADMARHMAEAMGVKLRLVAIPFPQLLDHLEAGKVDMVMSEMTITGGRNLKVAFVGPYFVSGKAFLTKTEKIASAKRGSEIDSPERTLVSLRGSTSQAFVEKVIPRVKLVLTDSYDEAVDMVIQGKVDALVADYPICMVSLLRYPEMGLVSYVTPLTYEPIGIALPAGDPLLVNWVGNFLNMLKDSGALGDLKKRWFEDRSWLRDLK